MIRFKGKSRLIPAAFAVAAAAVALAASPASAATVTINVAPAAQPKGANCVYVQDIEMGNTAGPIKFRTGRTAKISGFALNPGDGVGFEWHDQNCMNTSGPSLLRNDTRRAPTNLSGGVWNIN